MADIKDYTGSVNVMDDITPTTREKIDRITPERWASMSLTELWDQRIILNNRMIMAQNCGSYDVAIQLKRGLGSLDALLQQRSEKESSKDKHLL